MAATEERRRKLEKPAHPFKRLFAVQIDLLAWSVLSLGLVMAARSWDSTLFYWLDGALLLALLMFRDVYGPGSPGKVLTGLALVPADDIRSEALTLGARLARNIPLLLPIAGHTMELVVMAYAADGRRVGDRWAGTRVLDRRPETSEYTYLTLSLVALAALVISVYVLPFVWLGG